MKTKRQDTDYLGLGKVGRGLRELGENAVYLGLGALATAEQKGTEIVRELTDKGRDRDERADTMVERGFDEATTQLKDIGGRLERGVRGGTQNVLNRFGIPTHGQIEELITRVDRLNKKVDELKK